METQLISFGYQSVILQLKIILHDLNITTNVMKMSSTAISSIILYLTLSRTD